MSLLQYFADVTTKLKASEVNIPAANANDVLVGVLNAVYFAAGAIAVFYIVLAGFTFVTSVYDPAKVTQAKNSLLYSVIGLVVIIIAFYITQFVIGVFK